MFPAEAQLNTTLSRSSQARKEMDLRRVQLQQRLDKSQSTQPACTDPTWPRLYDALVLELSRSLERKKQLSKGRLHFHYALNDRVWQIDSASTCNDPRASGPVQVTGFPRSCTLMSELADPVDFRLHPLLSAHFIACATPALSAQNTRAYTAVISLSPCLVSSNAIIYRHQHITGGDCLEQAVVARMSSVYIRSVDTRYSSVRTVQSC
jgi:hypothetical protein